MYQEIEVEKAEAFRSSSVEVAFSFYSARIQSYLPMQLYSVTSRAMSFPYLRCSMLLGVPPRFTAGLSQNGI
jgi:hypothetical protein